MTAAPQIAGLGARVHLFVHPDLRDEFTAFLRNVLGCEVLERDFGMEHPILLVPFPDRSAFSVEFSDRAPSTRPQSRVDDGTAFRGAWIEFRTSDVKQMQQRLRDAGIPEFSHPGSNHTYFSAPGGQVFRILDLTYTGP